MAHLWQYQKPALSFSKSVLRKIGFPSGPTPLLRRKNLNVPWDQFQKAVCVRSPSHNSLAKDNGCKGYFKDDFILQEECTAENKPYGLICFLSATELGNAHEIVFEFLRPRVPFLQQAGRVLIIIGLDDRDLSANQNAILTNTMATEALTGFAKSLAKELGRKGSTVNMIRAPFSLQNKAASLQSLISFFLSPSSAYISGQVLSLRSDFSQSPKPTNKEQTILVTGAAQGIGAAIVQRLLENAMMRVVAVDRQFSKASDHPRLTFLKTDIGSDEFIEQIVSLNLMFDAVVHNAGITRDKGFRKMTAEQWSQVIFVNCIAVAKINADFLKRNLFADGARVVCMSSISGIAGNAGQTNYAFSKAALLAHVKELSAAAQRFGKSLSANAIAPGFIHTQMTARIPWLTRTIGARLNALGQAGEVEDVAEAVQLLCLPEMGAIDGQVLRVCGLNLLGR